ncbi:MAG: cupin domain-containing protein [Sphaerochaeta sp.]|jgi:mannose-6-phosphate isomerase-like protein (cupin superfamily)|nr:cupin domain-containing protein [Spirochaetales bacterium]
MIVRKDEMKSTVRSQMRGGQGDVLMTNLMEEGSVAHTRLFSTLTLPPGASIGEHDHVDETEYYWILKGQGVVTEADGEKVVRTGDLVVTGGGASHAIRNDGQEDLVFLALIILD